MSRDTAPAERVILANHRRATLAAPDHARAVITPNEPPHAMTAGMIEDFPSFDSHNDAASTSSQSLQKTRLIAAT